MPTDPSAPGQPANKPLRLCIDTNILAFMKRNKGYHNMLRHYIEFGLVELVIPDLILYESAKFIATDAINHLTQAIDHIEKAQAKLTKRYTATLAAEYGLGGLLPETTQKPEQNLQKHIDQARKHLDHQLEPLKPEILPIKTDAFWEVIHDRTHKQGLYDPSCKPEEWRDAFIAHTLAAHAYPDDPIHIISDDGDFAVVNTYWPDLHHHNNLGECFSTMGFQQFKHEDQLQSVLSSNELECRVNLAIDELEELGTFNILPMFENPELSNFDLQSIKLDGKPFANIGPEGTDLYLSQTFDLTISASLSHALPNQELGKPDITTTEPVEFETSVNLFIRIKLENDKPISIEELTIDTHHPMIVTSVKRLKPICQYTGILSAIAKNEISKALKSLGNGSFKTFVHDQNKFLTAAKFLSEINKIMPDSIDKAMELSNQAAYHFDKTRIAFDFLHEKHSILNNIPSQSLVEAMRSNHLLNEIQRHNSLMNIFNALDDDDLSEEE